MSTAPGFVRIPFKRTGKNHLWTTNLPACSPYDIVKATIPDGYAEPFAFGDTINDCFGFIGHSNWEPRVIILCLLHATERKEEQP